MPFFRPSFNKLIVATATAMTLTLNYVTIRPTDGAALTVSRLRSTIAQTGSDPPARPVPLP